MSSDFQFPVTTQSEGRTTIEELDRNHRRMQEVRDDANASQGPSTGDRHRISISSAELAKYREYPDHEIREDDFEIMLHNLTEPKTRVVKAR